MRIKKSCNGCKAFENHMNCIVSCNLGYRIDRAKKCPLEPCPKPLTNSKLVKLCNFKENSNL